MSISALNSGLSGMSAYQRALDSSAHNVANANTAGFTPQQVNFQESQSGGVTVTISKQGNSIATQDASGTDLTSELVYAIQYKADFDLSAKLVKTSDDILGTLIDIKA
ncbi:MAG: hypothetical protein HYZ65_16095 [Burkholderiales bacterium]|nr:hypothetical protein [Burkholderiales bacterium]